MKKMFLLLFVLFAGIAAQAQSVRVQNLTCQPILVAFYAPGAGSTQYFINNGAPPLLLDMYPGGTFGTPINWIGGTPPAPGSKFFTTVKVYDGMTGGASYTWTAGVIPATPNASVTGVPPCGTINVTSANWTTPLLDVSVN